MKIRYLQEGYIKTVDKMKDSLGKKLTADDIRKDTKKILLEPVLKMLEDDGFLHKCGYTFKHFVHPATSMYVISPQVIRFSYVDVVDGAINVICDVYYSLNHLDNGDLFWIDDVVINKYSIEEINEYIDNECTGHMLQYFNESSLELPEFVKRIHIEKINLWNKTPEYININGGLPEKLTVRLRSEFYDNKMLSETKFNELINKVNSLFSFCAKKVVIEKIVPIFEEHKDALANDVAALLDGNNAISSLLIKTKLPPRWADLQVSDKFDKLSIAGLKRKDLHEYTIDVVVKVIDLHKYLTNNDIEESAVKESSVFWAIPDVDIITTADYSEIEQIKCQLTEFIANIYNDISYRETKGKDLPDPKSGCIEYLLAAYDTTWTSDINPYVVNMDFVDGEYHKAYYTPLRKY